MMTIWWWDCTFLDGCAVQYEGKLADTGEVFDSTRDDNTVFSFEVGQGSVIRAWDIAIKTMQVRINECLLSGTICMTMFVVYALRRVRAVLSWQHFLIPTRLNKV
jgi:hypothetical protein